MKCIACVIGIMKHDPNLINDASDAIVVVNGKSLCYNCLRFEKSVLKDVY